MAFAFQRAILVSLIKVIKVNRHAYITARRWAGVSLFWVQWIKGIELFQRSLLIFLLLPVAVASAEAPDIQGAVELDVSASEVVNMAMGTGSVAQVIVGSIMQGHIVGNVKSVVTVEAISNVAEAANACSQVVLGSIGAENCMSGQ